MNPRDELDNDDGDIVPRSSAFEDPHFDITAMIDLVFMMNIYFLFTFLGAALADVELPMAKHSNALDADPKTTTVISVVTGAHWQTVNVFIGDMKEASPIADPDEQASRIAEAVQTGVQSGKANVLIKADKNIRLRQMARVTAAASQEGAKLHLAVMEKDD